MPRPRPSVPKEEFTLWNPELGFTQSGLNCWMTCPEMFKLSYGLGYQTKGFSIPLEFGTLIHNILEYTYTDYSKYYIRGEGKLFDPHAAVLKYTQDCDEAWRKEHPRATADMLQQWETLVGWAIALLPVYVEFWKKDLSEVRWYALEQEFCEKFPVDGLPYDVYLRGKIDGIYSHKGGDIWIMDTKTKYLIDDNKILDLLPTDLQMNLYAWAANRLYATFNIKGVMHNTIQRPRLRLKKNETPAELASRVRQHVTECPEEYFRRFELVLNPADVVKVEDNAANIIRTMHAWMEGDIPHWRATSACENKYGTCSFLPICSCGDFSNYQQKKSPFPELAVIPKGSRTPSLLHMDALENHPELARPKPEPSSEKAPKKKLKFVLKKKG
jgi:RecB family exonuclease